jgi:competence protein ComFB
MEETGDESVYNIPAIVGRLFNGLNFAPIAGIDVSLYRLGELVPMKDPNWQNPCRLVANTEGVFSFWPAPLPAEAKDLRQNIAFTLRAEFPGMSALEHVFEIPAISGPPSKLPVSIERTFKLEDLYMFPPEEEEQWERL